MFIYPYWTSTTGVALASHKCVKGKLLLQVLMHYGLSIFKLITKYNLNNINIDTKLFQKAYVNIKYADLKSNLLFFSVHLLGLAWSILGAGWPCSPTHISAGSRQAEGMPGRERWGKHNHCSCRQPRFTLAWLRCEATPQLDDLGKLRP